MSSTPPDEFKPRSPWGRMPSQTFTLSPTLPAAARPAPQPQPQPRARPASSILSGSALPVGPAYVAPPTPPEPAPPPVSIVRQPLDAPREHEVEAVTVVAPRRAGSRAPWLIGGAVAAVAAAGAAVMLWPREAPTLAEPLAPIAAAPAPAPVVETPPTEIVAAPAPKPVEAAPVRPAVVTKAPSAPEPAVELPAGPVPYAPQAQSQPRPPAPAPTTRLESIVPRPIQPPPAARPPADPNAPLETNDSY